MYQHIVTEINPISILVIEQRKNICRNYYVIPKKNWTIMKYPEINLLQHNNNKCNKKMMNHKKSKMKKINKFKG